MQFIREVESFFEENLLMRSLSIEVKSSFAKRCFSKKYSAYTSIVSQGDPAETLMFITKGGVKLQRKIRKRELKNLELTKEYKAIFKTLPEEIELELETLCKLKVIQTKDPKSENSNSSTNSL